MKNFDAVKITLYLVTVVAISVFSIIGFIFTQERIFYVFIVLMILALMLLSVKSILTWRLKKCAHKQTELK